MPISYRFFIVCAAVLMAAGVVAPVHADPDDLSVKAYQDAKRHAEKRSEARAQTEFAARLAEIEAMSNPGVIGEEITVRRLRGGSPVVTGRLYEVLPGRETYARIGDQRVNLSDLGLVDQKRIMMAVRSKAEVEAELKKQRAELDTLIENRVELLTRIHLEALGYTPSFFQNTVELGGYYYRYTALGDGRGQLVISDFPAEEDPYAKFYKVSIVNPATVPGLSVFTFDGKVVYVTFPEEKRPALVDATWRQVSFTIARGLADTDPELMMPKLLKVSTVRNKVGRWSYRLAPTRTRLSGNERATFRTDLLRDEIETYDAQMSGDFVEQVVAAREYQAKMVTDMEAERQRWEEEKAREPEPEPEVAAGDGGTAQVRTVASDELTQKRVELYSSFKPVLSIWYDASNPPQAELERGKIMGGDTVTGNPNMPTTVDGLKVIHVSPWVDTLTSLRDQDRGVNFVNVKSRFIELKPDSQTGAPEFRLEVAVFAHNRGIAAVDVRPSVEVTFKQPMNVDWLAPKDLSLTVAETYGMLPGWHGHLVKTVPISIELVMGGQESLTIKSLSPSDVADEATDEPVAEVEAANTPE